MRDKGIKPERYIDTNLSGARQRRQQVKSQRQRFRVADHKEEPGVTRETSDKHTAPEYAAGAAELQSSSEANAREVQALRKNKANSWLV